MSKLYAMTDIGYFLTGPLINGIFAKELFALNQL